jgi:hypothetical protein
MNKKTACQKLKESMKLGKVYRRQELELYSKSVSRDLEKLVDSKEVVRAGAGLYYRPKKTRFGLAPASSHELVRAFLNDGDFLFVSFNEYNLLGLGLTQLHNEQLVYNRKRYGTFELDGRKVTFRRPRNFPKKLTQEFLFVDLLNNIDELTSNTKELEKLVALKSKDLPTSKLLNAANNYGKVATRKFFQQVVNHEQ